MTDTGDDVLDIGEVVARTGIPPSTLHLWERRGLISPVARVGLRRQYDPSTVPRIGMIIAFQRGGFTLREISGILTACEDQTRKALRIKLEELQQRRQELDLAITGIEHGLRCDQPDPLACSHFREKAMSMLPTDRDVAS